MQKEPLNFQTDISQFVKGVDVNSLLSSEEKNISLGGLTLKLGEVTNTDDANQTFSFKQPYTQACISVFLQAIQSSSAYPIEPVSFTKDGFSINRDDRAKGAKRVLYLAFGV